MEFSVKNKRLLLKHAEASKGKDDLWDRLPKNIANKLCSLDDNPYTAIIRAIDGRSTLRKDLERYLEICENLPRPFWSMRCSGSLWSRVVKATKFLPEDVRAEQRVWHVINKTKKIPVCQNPVCNTSVEWELGYRSYHKYCSQECASYHANNPDLLTAPFTKQEIKSLIQHVKVSTSSRDLVLRLPLLDRKRLFHIDNNLYVAIIYSKYIKRNAKRDIKVFLEICPQENSTQALKAAETLYAELIKLTTFLPKDALARQRIWHFKEDIWEIPICAKPKCTGEVNFESTYYRKYCSLNCALTDPAHKIAGQATNLKVYGVRHAIQNSEVLQRCLRNSLRLKQVTIKGKTFDYLGYEDLALQILAEKYPISDIHTGEVVPTFPYRDNVQGRVYLPDIWVERDYDWPDLIIEVKSRWTILGSKGHYFEKVQRKARAVIDSNSWQTFILVVLDADGTVVKKFRNKEILNWSAREMAIELEMEGEIYV